MSYTVDWTQQARWGLAQVWLQSSRRQAVTAAQARIDVLLAADPRGRGVHVSEGLYVIEVFPLRAQFEIADAERVVTIVSVRELP